MPFERFRFLNDDSDMGGRVRLVSAQIPGSISPVGYVYLGTVIELRDASADAVSPQVMAQRVDVTFTWFGLEVLRTFSFDAEANHSWQALDVQLYREGRPGNPTYRVRGSGIRHPVGDQDDASFFATEAQQVPRVAAPPPKPKARPRPHARA